MIINLSWLVGDFSRFSVVGLVSGVGLVIVRFEEGVFGAKRF